MKAIGLVIAVLVGTALLALSSDTNNFFLIADRSSLDAVSANERWLSLINLRHNAFLHWRYDPLLVSLADSLPVSSQIAFPLAALLVFSVGFTLLLLRVSGHRARLLTLFLAILVQISLLGVFGWDSVLLSSLAWLPLFILCTVACLHGKEAFGVFLVLLCFFGYRISWSANALAPIFFLGALIISVFIFREVRPANRPILSPALLLTCLLAVIFSAVPYLSMPSVNIHGYPYYGHVVRDDDISEKHYPLLGPSTRIPFIDSDTVINYTGPIAVFLLVVCVVTALQARKSADRFARLSSMGALVLISLVLLDLYLPKHLAFIAPLSTLTRMVPGAILFPISEISLLFSILFLSVSFLCLRSVVFGAAALIALALIPPLELAPRLSRIHFNFSSFSPDEQIFAISPSLPVLKTLGPWVLRERSRIERTAFLPSNSIAVQTQASHNKPGNEVHLMLDVNRDTRWSPGRAAQAGDEWLYVRFPESQSLSGIELAGGHFKSDFPRALRISSLGVCPELPTTLPILRERAQEIIHYSPWDGTLQFTASGYPFYTAQTRVQAFFPNVVSTQCLFIEQTGSCEHLDWSVAELRLGVVTESKVLDDQE